MPPRGELAAPVVVLVGLLLAAPRYGFHRDELYFMSNGDHLAWGYVDHPPLTPLVGKVSQALFGDTVLGLRVLPAVVGAAIVWATAALCRELGGGRRARILSAWAVATTSMVMAMGHMLTTPAIDILSWTVAIALLCRIVRTQDRRLFVVVGAVVGVGLLNKFTVLLVVAAFGVALLTLPHRRLLASGWAAAGGALALALWAPHLWWQQRHGWPIVEFAAAAADDATENRVTAVPMLALLVGPPVALAIAASWWRVLRGRLLPAYRFVAVGAAAVVVLVLATGGKPYYAAGVLPALVAIAAIWWDGRTTAGRPVVPVVPVVLGVNAAVAALVTLPVLPVSAVATSPLVAVNPEPMEMVGWPALVDQVAAAYRTLDEGRGTTVILTANYGEAGAVDRFGGAHGLPPAYSGHNSYADVRVPPGDAGPVLLVGYREPGNRFVGCRPLSPVRLPYDVDNDEQGAPLWACDAPARPWASLWPDIRHVS